MKKQQNTFHDTIIFAIMINRTLKIYQ